MNVAAHQKKEDENKITVKKEAEKENRPAINFEETECCPSAVVQRAARRKNDWTRKVPGVTGTLGNTNSYFDPKRGRRLLHDVETAVD